MSIDVLVFVQVTAGSRCLLVLNLMACQWLDDS